LPDHLTVLLPTLARMGNPEDLAKKILPALEKIRKPLDEHGNPYRHLIRAVKQLLQSGDAALATRNPQLRAGGELC
jgi:nitrate reductase assembly molybdenum cofactor insertion protein NarJ